MFKKEEQDKSNASQVNLVGENGQVMYSVESKTRKKPKKKMKTGVKAALIIGVAIVIAFVAGYATNMLPGMNAEPAGAIVSAGVAEVMDIENMVTIKGTVVGSDSADVYSASNYRISEILVKEGDKVKKGQILAKLDASDLNDQYNVSRIAYNDAKRAYENSKALYAEGAIAKSDLDSAESAYKTAALNLDSYNITEKANVTSPIDGTITRVNCTVGRIAGDTNNNKGAMFVVENVENLKMEVKVGEFDIADIRVGQNVEISADILGKQTVTGVVSQIAPTGEAKADGTGMVIPVTIDIDKGDTNLIAGVTAKAKIFTSSREQVLTVPADAIFEDPENGNLSVFVIGEGNVVKQVPVTIGLEGDFNTEILEGDINDGDYVVLAPDFNITDGCTVIVM